MTAALQDSYRYLTRNQAQFLATLVEERFASDDDEGRAPWRARFSAIRNRNDIDSFIADIKLVKTIAQREREAQAAERQARLREAAAQRPTEPGYYRNPETGDLFRITKPNARSWDVNVHTFSEKAGPRRLITSTDQIKRGKWSKLNKWDSRRALSTISKDWAISVQDLAQDFAYGFCPLHHGPLVDGVSVVLGYGPDCAKEHGLPWSQEAADAKLAANRAAAERE